MAEIIAIVGPSGSGKSTSLRTLNPKETFIINVAGKSLPFRGFRKNYVPIYKGEGSTLYEGNLYKTHDVDAILKILKIINRQMLHVKNVIIEDAQYIMSFEAMERAEEKGYDENLSLSI